MIFKNSYNIILNLLLPNTYVFQETVISRNWGDLEQAHSVDQKAGQLLLENQELWTGEHPGEGWGL